MIRQDYREFFFCDLLNGALSPVLIMVRFAPSVGGTVIRTGTGDDEKDQREQKQDKDLFHDVVLEFKRETGRNSFHTADICLMKS